jgi:predicted house-cleaning noncanonical NTP pyrophosphatase (MazG superfamily)
MVVRTLSKPFSQVLAGVNRGKGELFMCTSDNQPKLEKRLEKSLLVIIVSLAVFACGFATLVLLFGKELKCEIFPLICFLAVLPLIGFTGFLGLVMLHYIKSFNFKNEEDFREKFKTDIKNEIRSLMDSNSKKNMEGIKEILEVFSRINSETMEKVKEILEAFSRINSGNK